MARNNTFPAGCMPPSGYMFWHEWADATPLYAIPTGYALVPVEQVKDARLLAWLLEKHGEQIRQILWSYDQCCSDEINALGVKAMLTAAAKGE